MHEFELINKYFSKLAKNNKNALNLNDDVFFDKLKGLVISIDSYVEGIHFFDFEKPDLVIKKIIRSSLSDLICKGVNPKYYFISGSGNKLYFNKKNLQKISKSLKQEQKKFNINLSGGDTVVSKKLNFSITSVGFAKKIVLRNNAKINDDIYVTGNLGDSYTGLLILKKKIKVGQNLKKYFTNKYYMPDLNLDLTNVLHTFANTSIDISDGLISDLKKLINKQKLSFRLDLNAIPISNNLRKIIKEKKLKKKDFISQGDDYQILFTANPSKSRIISKTAKSLGLKISKIGKISRNIGKSLFLDEKGEKIALKNNGYYHRF